MQASIPPPYSRTFLDRPECKDRRGLPCRPQCRHRRETPSRHNVEVEEGPAFFPKYLPGHNTRASRALGDGGAIVDWRVAAASISASVHHAARCLARSRPRPPSRAPCSLIYWLLARSPGSSIRRLDLARRSLTQTAHPSISAPARTALVGPALAHGSGRSPGTPPLDRHPPSRGGRWGNPSRMKSCTRFALRTLACSRSQISTVAHDPADPRNRSTRLYQALQADSRSRKLVARNLWRSHGQDNRHD